MRSATRTFQGQTAMHATPADPSILYQRREDRAMLLMMIGNVAMIYVPGLPLWSSLLVAFAARNSAVYFTKWYPEYTKAKYATPPASPNALSGI